MKSNCYSWFFSHTRRRGAVFGPALPPDAAEKWCILNMNLTSLGGGDVPKAERTSKGGKKKKTSSGRKARHFPAKKLLHSTGPAVLPHEQGCALPRAGPASLVERRVKRNTIAEGVPKQHFIAVPGLGGNRWVTVGVVFCSQQLTKGLHVINRNANCLRRYLRFFFC